MLRPDLRAVTPTDSSLTDAALVRAMIDGDRRAWRAFHARYDRLLWRCIGKIASRFSTCMGGDDTAEVYATVLVSLCANGMAKLRGFDAERGHKLSSWLGVIAVHATYDHLRALRAQPAAATLDEADGAPACDPTPDEALEMKQGLAIVDETLRTLSDKDREFFVLCFHEELDVEQIAARMHISVKTVYSRKHKLQTRIEARLFDTRVPEAQLAA
jgi:RNA polymerase sigma-70 factor (ECF subfamily)